MRVPAQVDSDAEVSEALSDFQYYLPLVGDSLARLAIHVAVRYARPVRVVMRGRSLLWSVPEDSDGVAYLFLAPTKAPRAVWGVETNVGLLDDATAYFGPSHRRRGADP